MTASNDNDNATLPARPRLAPALSVLLLALVCLGLILNQLQVRHREALHEHFLADSEHLTTSIGWHLSAYAQILHGAAGLFSASGQVSRDGWRRYVEQLDLDRVYGGILGVGYSQFIPAGQLAEHERTIRAQGFADYRVNPPGERAAYSSIVYLEPFADRNLRAFGYDMFSEPVRRAAMEQARDSGALAFSGKVTLVQETDRNVQAGILAYYPVYAQGTFPTSPEQRRAALLGWTYSPYRMNDLIEAMLKGAPTDIRLEIFDSAAQLDATTLLYDSRPGAARGDEPLRFERLASLQLDGGRTWTLRYSTLPGFFAGARVTPPWAEYAAAALIGLLLCGLGWALLNTRRRAERIATQMTASLRDSQREFRALSERLGEVIWATNIGTWEWNLADGTILLNERWTEIVGYRLDELAPTGIDAWRRLAHPDDLRRSDAELARCFNRECELYECEVRMRHRDGHWVWVQDRGRVVEWRADGRPLRVSGTHQDITARKAAEHRLQLAASVFDHAREGIVVTDADGLILEANRPFSEIGGYTREESRGRPVWLLLAGRHPERFFQSMRQAGAAADHWSGEVWCRRKGGELYAAQLTISAVRDAAGAIGNWVVLFNDITSSKAQQRQLEQMAYHDALTGLPNRTLLADRLQQAMAQADRNRQHLAVVYLDLDGFKAVNDRYGHDTGDELLIALARRMKATLREVDTLARIGGDEFVAVLAGLERPGDCERVLQRLLRAAAEPVALEAATLQVSASVGATCYPQPGAGAELLLQQADQAMYRAKHAGKNRFELFRPGGLACSACQLG
ncbi:CHASE domain-containing protein [Pseudomonas stutzeri]|nr:CHASE domain-containing protein [Stutzerimonas stutzeri]